MSTVAPSPQQPTQEALEAAREWLRETNDERIESYPLSLSYALDRFAAQRETAALEHLRDVLYTLAAPHPDYRCQALNEARVFYNGQCPEARIEPSDLVGPTYLIYDGCLMPSFVTAAADKARREALEEAAQITEHEWENLACPDHYSGQVARSAGRMAAERIRALSTPQNTGDAATERTE